MHQPATGMLHARMAASPMSDSDRALLMELTMGCLRQLTTLDAMIQLASGRPVGRIQPVPRMALRLCTYQLTYLDRIPEYAAVHGAVELAKQAGSGAGRFVNAVARRLGGLIGPKADQPTEADCSLPTPDGRWRLLQTPLVEADAPLAHGMAICTGGIAWLLQRWIQQYGVSRARQIAVSCTRRPPVVLRVNCGRSSTGQLVEALSRERLHATVDADGVALQVRGGGWVDGWPGFKEGWFQVQDRTAQQPVRWLDPAPGERILDLCAGLGTKSTQIAERMGRDGLLVASDVNADRLRQLAQNAARLGLPFIMTVDAKRLGEQYEPASFDAVLVDAPCSNTGVLARRPDVKHRLRAEDFSSLAELQYELLQTATNFVRPGGRIVYATCSIDVSENRTVIERIADQTSAQILRDQRFWSPADIEKPWCDGGYVALLQRSASGS